MHTAGPSDFYRVGFLFCSQSKNQPQVVPGKIARSGLYLPYLGVGASYYFHACTYPITVAFDPNGFYHQPIVSVPSFVAEQHPFLIQIHHKDIGVAIVIIIAKGGTAPYPFNREILAGLLGEIYESALSCVDEKLVRLCIFQCIGFRWIEMTIGDKEI